MYTVTPLVCAHTTAPKAQLLRNAGWGEQLCIASVAWLIRGQGRIMLIDTSLGGAWNDPAFATTRSSLANWKVSGGGVVGKLSALGISPEDIDTVMLTHLHTDHIASLPAFGAARIVVSRTGWDRVRAESHPWFDTYSREIFSWMTAASDRIHLVSDDDEIPGGISFRWMGGHSPCSQAVALQTKVGRTAFAGDLVPLTENWLTGIPTGHYQNLREVAEAYAFLSDFDAVVPGHDPQPLDWMDPAP